MPPLKRTHAAGSAVPELRAQLQAEMSRTAELLKNPDDNPICSITYDPSFNGLYIAWKTGATSSQLRFIHEYLLGVLAEKGLTKILGDDTALEGIPAEDREWISRDWLPRAISAGLRAAASKTPDSEIGRISITDVQEDAPRGVILGSFDDIAEARCWLEAFGD